jgi:hypothetical protein
MIWPVPLNVLRDSVRVLSATLRMLTRQGVRGHFYARPFDTGENTPQDAARRALAVLETSLAPNSFVINVDCEQRRLLVHQFLPESADNPKLDKEPLK